MNSVTKNVKMSLKLTGLALLSSVFIIGCNDESDNKRKSLAIYQGAPKAEKVKKLGIKVEDDIPSFEVTSDHITNLLNDEEIEFFKKTLPADEKINGSVISFNFLFTDQKLVELIDDEVFSIAFYSKDSKGQLTKRLAGWVPLRGAFVQSQKNNKVNFGFEYIASNPEMVKTIKEELSKKTRDRNEDNPDEADASEFMNFHIALSVDRKEIIKSIDLKDLCNDHPDNFLNKDKEPGCDAL